MTLAAKSSIAKKQQDSSDTTLFFDLVGPVYKKLRNIQWHFERLSIDDVEQHVAMLQDIHLTEHSVWVAIALATVELNPELVEMVERNKPCSVSSADRSWIEYCLEHSLIPLMDEGSLNPIRFVQR